MEVLRFQIRIRFEDLGLGHAVSHHVHDGCDGNSQTSDARNATHLLWIDGDARK